MIKLTFKGRLHKEKRKGNTRSSNPVSIASHATSKRWQASLMLSSLFFRAETKLQFLYDRVKLYRFIQGYTVGGKLNSNQFISCKTKAVLFYSIVMRCSAVYTASFACLNTELY